MIYEPLGERMVGRWKSVLPMMGVPSQVLTNRHGPCPICGGRDRFRFDDKGGRGTWICNQCGSGDGTELVKKFFGIEFKEAAQRIEPFIGQTIAQAAKDEASDQRKAEWSRALWKRSVAITADCPAGIYLADRCSLTEYPACLRFAPDERYTADPGKRATHHPVMVARMTAPDDSKNWLHRTYLTHDGLKAPLKSAKAMMPGAILPGAAVRLAPVGDIVGIAEGIETALSASMLFDVPVWAALNAHMLESWVPPASAEHVMIFGDNDTSNIGQAAAYALGQRLRARGMPLDVKIPDTPGDDWNDVWAKRKGDWLKGWRP